MISILERRKRALISNTLKKCLRCMPALLLMALLCLNGTAETVLATESTQVYQYPSTSAPSASIPAGTTMEKTAEKDGWIRVERAGRTAYMRASLVERVTDCNAATGYISGPVPMYKSYGKASKYGTLPTGTAVTVYAVAGNWAYIGVQGYRGYVRKDALTAEKPKSDSENGNGDGSGIIVTKGEHAYVSVDGAKVYKTYSTSSKMLGALPLNTRLDVDAVGGDWACVRLNGNRGFMKLEDLSEKKVEGGGSASDDSQSGTAVKGTAKSMDWWSSGIQTIFARGVTATITDVATGISWREVRKGGSGHADCQPLTAADTAAMKSACGQWSWARRAIFVTIDGVNYAASMNCMPHGSGSISDNNYNGHHCIHFTNSKTHSNDQVCPQHQAAIQKALSSKL